MKMLDTLLLGNYDGKSANQTNQERQPMKVMAAANSNSDLTDTLQQDNSILTQQD